MAATSITAGKASAPAVEGCLPPTFQPAIQTTTLAIAIAAATIAAIVIASGRSPGASGSSCARIAASRSSPRSRRGAGRAPVSPAVLRAGLVPFGEGVGRAPGRRLRLRCANGSLQLHAQRARRRLGIGRLGERADDDDPARAALDHLAHVAGVQPADGEPRALADVP